MQCHSDHARQAGDSRKIGESPLYSPQDLARLVLGYLEEEECTLAYDQFIRGSPYLEDFRTNYNNAILSNFSLKPLKDVFSEYCAFKAYTRNCKIPGLRTKLLQCKTLLDAAELLIANVDIKKIQNLESANLRHSLSCTPSSYSQKSKLCDQCKTIGNGCHCQVLFAPNSLMNTNYQENVAGGARTLQNLVETTQLSDLPAGTHHADKLKADDTSKSVKQNSTIEPSAVLNDAGEVSYENADIKNTLATGGQDLNLCVKTNDEMDCSDDINEILDIVSHNSVNVTNSKRRPNDKTAVIPTHIRRSSIGDKSFKFVHEVTSVNNNAVPEAVPDSSTPESNMSLNHQFNQMANFLNLKPAPMPTLGTRSQTSCPNLKPSKIDVHKEDKYSEESGSRDSIVTSDFELNMNSQKQVSSSSNKDVGSKVTILSNDLLSTGEDGTIILNKRGKPTALRPLPKKPVGVKTSGSLPPTNSIIHINGLPAYQQQTPKFSSTVFTKEEIMAMPTVIVLQPSSTGNDSLCNSSYLTTAATSDATSAETTNTLLSSDTTLPDGTYRSLEPISMEVEPISRKPAEVSSQLSSDDKKTVSLGKKSTPNRPLAPKKASSTPRRSSSSHVRVLDFTTPCQVLPKHEELEDLKIESLLTSSQITKQQSFLIENNSHTLSQARIKIESVKKVEKKSKADWDADLRALLPTSSPEPTKQSKAKSRKKSLSENIRSTKKSQKRKKSIKNKESDEPSDNDPVTNEPFLKNNVVKPTINLIKDWRDEPKSTKSKDEDKEKVETPETDMRPPTEIPSTTKHNLSDLFLLQTPYKMIMDNIQMDTPRYIDPSVFDVPMSDIKIDSIPTPNFLNTPNFLLSGGKTGISTIATPSSYSSRPTDYSSGGSYYRPDEHDYIPQPDLEPSSKIYSSSPNIPSTSKEITKTSKSKNSRNSNSAVTKSSRPRRQCTLKVSYCETVASKTTKEVKDDISSDRESRASSVSSQSSNDSVKSSNNSKDSTVIKHNFREDVLKHNVCDDKEEILRELEQKRRRTISSLKKKTPVKKTRKRNSFPKVKIEKKTSVSKKTRTVADLKNIGPRKIPNSYKDKQKSKNKTQLSGKNSSDAVTNTVPIPTKSRRKSSTPRKVEKNIVHSMDDSASTEMLIQKQTYPGEDELPPLRVSSDDGSQDSRFKKVSKFDDTEEDITQIKAYIENTTKEMEPTIHELVQRGFDIETAKSIERDLLGGSARIAENNETIDRGKIIVDVAEQMRSSNIIVTIEQSPKTDSYFSKTMPKTVEVPNLTSEINTHNVENNSSHTSSTLNTSGKNDSAIILEGDILMTRHTFGEENEIRYSHEYNQECDKKQLEPIDTNFALNIQCEDLNIKVCLGKHEVLYDIAPKENIQSTVRIDSSDSSSSDSDGEAATETLTAIQSISNINPLYTPMKCDPSASIRKQCLEIFDSTLNSLDTPVKTSFSKSSETLTPRDDDERAQESWSLTSKRKKSSCSPIQEPAKKKNKPDHQILMQNIDIESLLTKLHGDST